MEGYGDEIKLICFGGACEVAAAEDDVGEELMWRCELGKVLMKAWEVWIEGCCWDWDE